MHWWASIAGIVLIFIILMDAFETVVLPRRIKRIFRITGWFYRNTWGLWTRVGRHIKSANRREGFLAYFGPLSLIPLMGFWALGLIFGFACVQYGLGEHLSLGNEKITFGKVRLSERRNFLHAGLRRHHAQQRRRARPGRDGSGHGLRVPRSRDRISAGYLQLVCRARD